MPKPNYVMSLIRCQKDYEEDVKIKLGVSAGRSLFTKKTQTQTDKKLQKKDRNMLKVTSFNCKTPEYMSSECKYLKQPQKLSCIC